MQSITIVIANNHFLVREGLKAILKEMNGVEVLAECTSSESLIPVLEAESGLLIIDPSAMDGFSFRDMDLLMAFPGWQVLAITECHQAEMVKALVESGVSGFLTPTCDRAEIEEAVHHVARGETIYCHKVLDLLMQRTDTMGSNCEPAVLSEREIEIVRLIAVGLTTREIAGQLYRSSHTISTHRKNIMRKLNLRTSSELMVYAVNTGLVTS